MEQFFSILIQKIIAVSLGMCSINSVSYTHLDVYKRQDNDRQDNHRDDDNRRQNNWNNGWNWGSNNNHNDYRRDDNRRNNNYSWNHYDDNSRKHFEFGRREGQNYWGPNGNNWSRWNNSWGDPNYYAVSYTHLDVYKRQILYRIPSYICFHQKQNNFRL